MTTPDDNTLELRPTSAFLEACGLHFTEITGTRVTGTAELDERHHTPFGVVHGGLYAALVETAASVGASKAVEEAGKFAVGLHNGTDFLRSSAGCTAEVVAEAIQQGRTQQLWLVTVTDAATGKSLARGQLRLQNIPLPEK